ncbi:hypothetical protein CVT25_011929 [Psilocybe cyanescens]|uniref:Uncharacterized protein n=1 Tax=Psilocybe cyanescens TaxID=93625 RepID=A0A409XQG0_PSICY|nr:hypothetical protein CVT25_011929 [Psilocybe cyanescens]
MSDDRGLPPVSVQISVVSNQVNSIMTQSFLMGFYSMVYFSTLYLYLSKRGPKTQRRIIVIAISMLYVMCALIFSMNWYSLNWAIVDNGETRESMFIGSVQAPTWTFITYVILQFSLPIVADSLLIWRCFYIWDRSLRVIAGPLFFFIAEIGYFTLLAFFILVTVYAFKIPQLTSPSLARLINNLQVVDLCISFGTTFITTILIGYRIHSTTRIQGVTRLGKFKHIVEILVQSAALYALVILFNAIFCSGAIASYSAGQFWPQVVLPIVGVSKHFNYETSVLIEHFIQGMAPTMVVARISMTNFDNTHLATISHISGLKFQSERARQNETDMGAEDIPYTDKINEDSHSNNEKSTVANV